jgi:hypothetical protein
MKANLNSFVYFDNDSFSLQIKSGQRNVVEKNAAGLDGTVSIDLGSRARKIIQTGQLRAANKSALNEKIADIDEMFDGQLRTLSTPDGRIFENLRMDSFQTGQIVSGGSSVSCDYEIVYTQLG